MSLQGNAQIPSSNYGGGYGSPYGYGTTPYAGGNPYGYPGTYPGTQLPTNQTQIMVLFGQNYPTYFNVNKLSGYVTVIMGNQPFPIQILGQSQNQYQSQYPYYY
jgi:hypothetical protein